MGYVYLDLDQTSKITIGDNFTMSSGDFINPLCKNIKGEIHAGKNARLKIGDNVGLSSPCIWVSKRVEIMNNVMIGGNTIIIDTDAHSLDWKLRSSTRKTEDGTPINVAAADSKPIVIEDDVMVGANCVILKGVRIGARSVIGAGSIVTKNIPSDCIAAGNPCRVVRSLDSKK